MAAGFVRDRTGALLGIIIGVIVTILASLVLFFIYELLVGLAVHGGAGWEWKRSLNAITEPYASYCGDDDNCDRSYKTACVLAIFTVMPFIVVGYVSIAVGILSIRMMSLHAAPMWIIAATFIVAIVANTVVFDGWSNDEIAGLLQNICIIFGMIVYCGKTIIL